MRKNIIWISLFSFAMTTIAESSIASANTGIFPLLAKNRKKAEPKDSVASDYKKLTGRDSVALKGIANIIKKNGSFYLEFPTRLLGREFLVTNRLQKVPLELNEAGVNKGINYENQTVTFEWQREGKKLCIRQQRLTPEVPATDALASSVADNYINPLIASLKIEAVAPDSSTVVVKIDELFNGKQTGLNDVFNNINLGTSANSDLSRILDIKAFESNITATSELTTIVREGMSKVNVTVVVSSSLSLLPEIPMRGRKESKKVGYFTSHRLSYSDRQQELETRHYITRWRLEPTDEAAYLRGELTSPKKPITFYIDPATPKQLRPYIRKGILDWNTAFEQAGFKDAVRVEEYTDSMAAEGDDLKYSLFTYAASEKSNAMGPSVIDPRTGEIIEADIIWWHNVVSLLREWIVIQTGAVNPAVRNPELPDSLMGDAARFVACHEVGHSLGLKHNMIASWAYPTDSLRSPGFMSPGRRHGIFHHGLCPLQLCGPTGRPRTLRLPTHRSLRPLCHRMGIPLVSGRGNGKKTAPCTVGQPYGENIQIWRGTIGTRSGGPPFPQRRFGRRRHEIGRLRYREPETYRSGYRQMDHHRRRRADL